jgi:hypothetical protein
MLVAGVCAGAFLIRWVTLDFENDYFMHMSWAAEMLRGQWPVRDFVEPGFPLQTFLAFAGLRLGGYQLLWEAVIACGSIAAGASAIYLVCRRLGLPPWLAVTAVVIAIAAFPRMYAYPKAFVYPAALYVLMRYLGKGDGGSMLPLAGITAIAFLFRHDHGVWIGLATVVTLVIFHGTRPGTLRHALARYGGWTLALVAPWLIWVAASGHADQYFDFLRGQSAGLTNRGRIPDRRLHIDFSRPLVSVTPIKYPSVGIRWSQTATEDVRRQLESRYSLIPTGNAEDDYRLLDVSSSNVQALLLDPAIEDTRGIDRASARAPGGMFPWIALKLQQYVPVVRLRVLPGLVNGGNADPWLTWVTFTVPWIAGALALGRFAIDRRSQRDRWGDALIAGTAVMSIVTYQTLVRSSPDSRLGDVGALTSILLAWLVWRAWPLPGWRGRVTKPVAIVLVAAVLASAIAYGRIVPRLEGAGVDGPTNFVRRAWGQPTLYGGKPLDLYAPPGAPGLAGLARWIYECTHAEERVAVIGFEPQVFFLAERGFAGGLAFYDLGWNSSQRAQALTIERWSRQRVPIILAMESEWSSFSRDYPAVRAWIDRHYDSVTRSDFGGGKTLTVMTGRTYAPAGRYGDSGLPCFSSEAAPQTAETR